MLYDIVVLQFARSFVTSFALFISNVSFIIQNELIVIETVPEQNNMLNIMLGLSDCSNDISYITWEVLSVSTVPMCSLYALYRQRDTNDPAYLTLISYS